MYFSERSRIRARACGNALARAHARSGDPVAIDAYMGKDDTFTKAMRKFARRYAGLAAARMHDGVHSRLAGRRHEITPTQLGQALRLTRLAHPAAVRRLHRPPGHRLDHRRDRRLE